MRVYLKPVLPALAALFCIVSIGACAQSSGPKLAVLDRPTWDRVASRGGTITTQLDLITLRYDPSLLDSREFMRYFIALNNCGDRTVARSMDSEFDYPPMVAFYKPKAQEIAKVVPNDFIINMGSGFNLGEYDMARKAFPFVTALKRSQPVDFNNVTPSDPPQGVPLCPGTLRSVNLGRLPRRSDGGYDMPFPAYMVKFKDVKFSELPMDEEAARAFAARFRGGIRMVSILLDIEVLPDAPKIEKHRMAGTSNDFSYITFNGTVKKIEILNSLGQPLGDINP